MSIPSSGSHPTSRNLSSRPTSRTTSRTPVGRPASSLSVRPTSSASSRPQSRFSQQRPHSRQARSRLLPVCQILVAQATGLNANGCENDPEGEVFREKVDYAMRHLTTMVKTAASADMGVIDRQISGHALKARINSKDDLAKALEVAYRLLKTHLETQETDLDNAIKTAHIPDHMQFLLALSRPPSRATEANASSYLDEIANPPLPPVPLTWQDILAEEPFEGDHWEGVNFPGRLTSINEPFYDSGGDSEPSLSPLNSDDLALDEESDSLSSADFDEALRLTRTATELREKEEYVPRQQPYPFDYRKHFDELQSRQYWRDDWHTDARLYSLFDLGDPSTLGPTLNRVLAQASGFHDAQAMLKPERYINEDDMVREVLMALQGNKNIVLTWSDGAFKTTPNTPRLIHLSLASQESIVHSLAKTATTVEQLRRFTAAVFSLSISRSTVPPADGRPSYISKKDPITRTCEAFADAINHTTRGFDSWCAAREEAICRASAKIHEKPIIASLLHTEKGLSDEYATSFEVLLEIVRNVFQLTAEDSIDSVGYVLERNRQSPAAQTALLLDTLFAAGQRHMERRDLVTSGILMKVFVRTAEPVWGMMGRWLKDGMGLAVASRDGGSGGGEQEDEFFIESSGLGFGMMGLGLLDPDFWNEGYSLREVSSSTDGPHPAEDLSTTTKAVPLFLQHVADLVLGTGKAVGLLRTLDTHTSFNAFEDWTTFSELIESEVDSDASKLEKGARLFSVSVDDLSRTVYDNLSSKCQAVGEKLVQVLVSDCALWKHLGAIEDLYLTRKGDTLSHFVDIVFAKMDSQQPWSDFHFLNTAFNDVVKSNARAEAGARDWINPSLVRLSYRASRGKDQTVKRTVKAIDGLVLEYSVPFPLIYIFQPKELKAYNEIFNFLLQIRRAKSMLERILVRDVRGKNKGLNDELKAFYAMRSRLSWFINTLLNFLTTYVIHSEVARFHHILRDVRSLDEMIQLHDDHLGKIRGRCLLKPNTAALHRTILSILDMCLHFSEGFVTFAGDTTATLDVSRQSLNLRHHRSRRQRKQRRNVIGFSQFLQDDTLSSEDDEEEGDVDVESGMEPSISSMLGNSTMDTEGDFFGRVERMSTELDGLVRFLRRGVESLAGGTSDAASAFGVLAFALENWDI